jgi:indole-3-glycerol phosphate synthase
VPEHLPNSKISRTTPETQANSQWTPPVGTLGELVRRARLRSEKLHEVSGASSTQSGTSRRNNFRDALKRETVSVIAEVKRSSPSKGSINPGIDAAAQAIAYERGGASAISVLTEPDQFGGSNDDLMNVARAVFIPVLKKDFHVTTAQLDEAAALGASSALLILRAIDPRELSRLAEKARELELEILYEVRDERELARALDVGAEIIGVNNRNLETLEIDPSTVARIVPLIPEHCVAIAESGYHSREDVENAALAGADAVLIGSSLSGSLDPESAVRRICGISRRSRGV